MTSRQGKNMFYCPNCQNPTEPDSYTGVARCSACGTTTQARRPKRNAMSWGRFVVWSITPALAASAMFVLALSSGVGTLLFLLILIAGLVNLLRRRE